MTEPTAENESTCRVCGDPIESSDDRRVVTTVEGGEAIHRQFCSEDCLSERES